MSKKFDIISIVLMIVLVAILFIVVFNYFTKSTDLTSLPVNNINTDIYNNQDLIITNNSVDTRNSGDTSSILTQVYSGDVNESGDAVMISSSGEISENSSGENHIISPSTMTSTQPHQGVIMTSANDISNQEKKQILKELDNTLMDLLDVVDLVQVVDESRLITDESEVQE